MPNVTIDASEYEKFDLKSAPPDGFVMLRPLPYGMKLTRRDKALKMRMINQRQRKNQPQNQDQVIELDSLTEWSTMYDMTYCIGEHNLTDSEGQLLDFNNPKRIEMILKSMDPKVGSEIEKYLGELNEDDEEELLEDFMRRQHTSSEGELPTLPTDSSVTT